MESDNNIQINHKGIWKRFWFLYKNAQIPYGFLALYILSDIVVTIFLVKIPQINADFFNGDASVTSVAMFIGAEMLSTALVQVNLYFAHMFRYRTDRNLRNVFWKKILNVKPKFYDQVAPSALLSRITVDTGAFNEFLMDVVISIAFSVYTLILTIFEMSGYSLEAAFWLLAFVPFSLLISFIMGRINLKIANNMKYKMSKLTEYLSELVASMAMVKAFNRQEYETKRGQKAIDDYYKSNRNYVFVDVLRQILGTVVSTVPEVVLILIGVQLLNAQKMDAAGWYVFFMYAGSFLSFFSSLGGYWERAKSVQGQLYMVASVLSEEEEGIQHYVDDIIQSNDVSFDNVDFAYEENKVLDKASFTIPKNKITALIGYSGMGKTTALKLFSGIYTPDEGRIMMGGKNLSDMDIKEWRSKMAFVSQNAPMISGTIRENITYGIKRDVTDEEIMKAAKLAHVDEFIMQCEDGLFHEVGQFGGKLSGGQKQKISIARAILAKPEYLVLDEPTSSLDIISTNEIAQTLRSLAGTMTIVMIAHQQEVIRIADHIVLFDNNHLIIEGDREKDFLSNEFYTKLFEKEKED